MVRLLSSRRFLAIYSGCLTLVFAVTMLAGFARSPQSASFDQITVHRINVVEPDGTPRLIVSNKASFPGDYIHGKEVARPDRRDSAGLMFYNDEGTEDGGLIYGGKNDASGTPSSFSHLSFDQYDQDQTVDLGAGLQDGKTGSGLSIVDAGKFLMTPEFAAEAMRFKMMPHGPVRAQAYKELQARYPPSVDRAYFGSEKDKSVGVTLRDEEGRARLRMLVRPDGEPVLQFLDAAGKVTKEISGGK
jgi:hypothetical protein